MPLLDLYQQLPLFVTVEVTSTSTLSAIPSKTESTSVSSTSFSFMSAVPVGIGHGDSITQRAEDGQLVFVYPHPETLALLKKRKKSDYEQAIERLAAKAIQERGEYIEALTALYYAEALTLAEYESLVEAA